MRFVILLLGMGVCLGSAVAGENPPPRAQTKIPGHQPRDSTDDLPRLLYETKAKAQERTNKADIVDIKESTRDTQSGTSSIGSDNCDITLAEIQGNGSNDVLTVLKDVKIYCLR